MSKSILSDLISEHMGNQIDLKIIFSAIISSERELNANPEQEIDISDHHTQSLVILRVLRVIPNLVAVYRSELNDPMMWLDIVITIGALHLYVREDANTGFIRVWKYDSVASLPKGRLYHQFCSSSFLTFTATLRERMTAPMLLRYIDFDHLCNYRLLSSRPLEQLLGMFETEILIDPTHITPVNASDIHCIPLEINLFGADWLDEAIAIGQQLYDRTEELRIQEHQRERGPYIPRAFNAISVVGWCSITLIIMIDRSAMFIDGNPMYLPNLFDHYIDVKRL